MHIKVYICAYLLLFGALFALTAMHGAVQPDGRHGAAVAPAATDTLIRVLSGKLLYQQACAQCHGVNGSGQQRQPLGLSTPVPDFTDCSFATREPDADWLAIAHQGGPVRAFSREMPAFGQALTPSELQQIMDHVRSFCTDHRWPRGELNLPRALRTEKAYPEDEVVVSSFIDVENEGGVMNRLVYEQRLGSRSQFEVVVPFGFAETAPGRWSGGQLGDVALGFKRTLYHNVNSGSIVSVTGEMILPTGDRPSGFGKGTAIAEPFVSVGQILPGDTFFQFQGGAELPLLRDKAADELFWRGVWGISLTQGRWGRTWSPMVEVLGARELESGAINQWSIIPQLQVTLSRRQHIMMNVGVEIPAEDASRDSRVMVYLLWDWFDGGLLEGW